MEIDRLGDEVGGLVKQAEIEGEIVLKRGGVIVARLIREERQIPGVAEDFFPELLPEFGNTMRGWKAALSRFRNAIPLPSDTLGIDGRLHVAVVGSRGGGTELVMAAAESGACELIQWLEWNDSRLDAVRAGRVSSDLLDAIPEPVFPSPVFLGAVRVVLVPSDVVPDLSWVVPKLTRRTETMVTDPKERVRRQLWAGATEVVVVGARSNWTPDEVRESLSAPSSVPIHLLHANAQGARDLSFPRPKGAVELEHGSQESRIGQLLQSLGLVE